MPWIARSNGSMRGIFRFRGRRDGARDAAVILSSRQQELLAEESRVLDRLAAALAAFPATEEDRAELRRASEQLGDLFLLVIVGEFNAGKSAFINAMLGAEVMPEGVTPTTSVINLLRYGDEPVETMLPEGIIQRTWPAPMLEEITVVDTPGTNAIIREHESLTQQFVPRADLVLFVTSADRPFSESEREFMAAIREWGKKIVIILNKIDLLRDDEQREQVVSFVRENVERLLGFKPEIFPVSALLAQQARRSATATRPSATGCGTPASSSRWRRTSSRRSTRRGASGSSSSTPSAWASTSPTATSPPRRIALRCWRRTWRRSTGSSASWSCTARTCTSSSPTT
jgi:small GTP-binding protein